MPLFKKKTEGEEAPRRSKYVDAPRVFVSLERVIQLGPYGQNYKMTGGVTLGVGDTMTIMKQGAATVQENETVADAFARAFQATNDGIDAHARKEGLKEIMDKSFTALKADNSKEITTPPAKPTAKPAPKPTTAKPPAAPKIEELT